MKLRLCRGTEKGCEYRLFDTAHCRNEAGVTLLEVNGISKTELKRKAVFVEQHKDPYCKQKLENIETGQTNVAGM